MTADEREARIADLSGLIAVALSQMIAYPEGSMVRDFWHERSRELSAEQRALIAQRTPAEVEHMERERGLR